jgi:hypothetical protein
MEEMVEDMDEVDEEVDEGCSHSGLSTFHEG